MENDSIYDKRIITHKWGNNPTNDELAFLQSYEKARAAMRQIVDMPEIKANHFLKLCHQNNGVISNNKRKSQFPELKDDEVLQLQEAIRLAYLDSDPPAGVDEPEPNEDATADDDLFDDFD